MRYATWYDNCSGYLEAFKIIEASAPDEAIAAARDQGLDRSTRVVATEATEQQNGFGNDPNTDKLKVLATSPTA